MAVKSLCWISDTSLLVSSNRGVQIARWKTDGEALEIKWPGRADLPYKWIDGNLLEYVWTQRSTCSYYSNSLYYIGTQNGLYLLGKDLRIHHLDPTENVFSKRIIAIEGTPSGIIWVATDGEGLIGLKDEKIIARFTRKEGLTSDICRAIYLSGNDIWVGTDKGLNKIAYTGTPNSVATYSTTDGLASDIINTVYVKGHDVYVGTAEGLNVFNEEKIRTNSSCTLIVDGIVVSGKDRPIDTAWFELPHKDNNIRVAYSGISYRSAGDIQYRFRLAGLDDNWKITRENFLSYPSLPSGNYKLELQAINKFGVASNLVTVRFSVTRLIWERTWFRILLAAGLAAIILLFFQLSLRRVRRKESEKAATVLRMSELEQMALRSQINPHFIFNSLNSIQEFVMDKDVLGANEFITNFSRLIRQTLDLSSRPLITLEEEINYLSTYLSLEKRRFDNKFMFDIWLDESIDPAGCRIPPMILQPYLENAVRYGIGYRHDKNGRIFLRVDYEMPYMTCIIEDNGVGRKKAGLFKSTNSIQYQSQGMSMVAKRIEMINKAGGRPILLRVEDLHGTNGEPAGTRIVVKFPVENQNAI
jgi:hypothetical protein